MITTVKLFEELERLRAQAILSMDDVLPLVDVSKVTYIKWVRGQIPDSHREPMLREAVQLLHVAIDLGQLPVRGKPKSQKTGEKRRGILTSPLSSD